MQVAIIGAGNVGKALAGTITRAGHEVTLSASTPEHAAAAAAESGARAASGNAAAARDAEVVILAVPFVGAAEAVAREIAPVVAGKTVVDATNPLTTDYSGLATNGTSGAELVQSWLPDATVIKAFNTLFAASQAEPDRAVEAFVAGEPGDSKQQVISLVDAMGFTPFDAGSLSAARYLEAMAFLNISLNAANDWGWTSTWKLER